MKEYLPIENSEYELKCEVYYSKGGMNYWNYKDEPRGYYGSVTLVKRERGEHFYTESFSLSTGAYKTFLVACKRKGKKIEEAAITLWINDMRDKLISRILEEGNFNQVY